MGIVSDEMLRELSSQDVCRLVAMEVVSRTANLRQARKEIVRAVTRTAVEKYEKADPTNLAEMVEIFVLISNSSTLFWEEVLRLLSEKGGASTQEK